MQIRTKIYLLQFLLTILFFVVVSFIYYVMDISEHPQEFQETLLLFFGLVIAAIALFMIVFIWTTYHMSRPTNIILQSMGDMELIEDEALLTQKDEFGIIAKEYNELVLKVESEMKKNQILLLENKRFITDTVQQIRSPLDAIQVNNDLIKMSLVDDSNEKYFSEISASINMLANSYEDLAYISFHDELEYKKKYLCLSEILEKRVKFFSEIAEVNQKTLLVMIESGLFLNINEVELERLIDNNISNAIKYADINKPITIELEKDEDEIRLSFYSYAEAIKNVSLLFDKKDKENKDKKGLGLGLTIVKSICEKYNISYEVKYENNQNIFTYIFKI